MEAQQAVRQASDKYKQAPAHLQTSLKSLRTGRASSAMLDGVIVEAYGTPMPLNQVATVTAPEAQMIQISPFDPSNIQAIANAIRNNPNLGMNPSDDGRIIRVPVPALTEDRRREIVKQVGSKQEDCMISLRGIRRDAFDAIDKAKKAKELGEDDAKRLEKQVDDTLNAAKAQVEAIARSKESEIMTV